MKPSLVLVATALILAALEAAPSTAAAADQLPDLAMAKPTDIRITMENGRRLLRYTTVIVNAGSGPFEVVGSRASTTETEMPTAQRIYDGSGANRTVDTDAKMFFAGDDHSHWHVRDLESGDLVRLNGETDAVTSAKRGFCFFDNVAYDLNLPGASPSPVYPGSGCGGSQSLSVKMGLSVGWGDRYSYSLAFQYIDVTGLEPGRYNLISTADESNWFTESDESNNQSSVEVELTASPVAVRVYAGTIRSGDSSRLAANDNSFFQMNSSSGKTSWYGRFSDVPNDLTNLRLNYRGKSSLRATQALLIRDFDRKAWVPLDTRGVGTAEASITEFPTGDLSRFVSGTAATGDLIVAVRSTRNDSKKFVTSADLMTDFYDSP